MKSLIILNKIFPFINLKNNHKHENLLKLKFLLILFLILNLQIIREKAYNYPINAAAKKAKNFLSICIKGSLISKKPIIIIVNDYSSDNTSIIIEQIKKEDKRIRLINNKKNLGTLYTRCIGTSAAKGKYIFPLDGDDIFLDKDIIRNIYNL